MATTVDPNLVTTATELHGYRGVTEVLAYGTAVRVEQIR